MVIQEVRTVGVWVACAGILIGLFGFLCLGSYVPDRGFLWNVQHQMVIFPFLHGDNPLGCLADSFRRLIPNPTGEAYKPEPGCHASTTMPFKYLFSFAVFVTIVGVCLLLHKVQVPNPWPTEWTPLRRTSVRADSRRGQDVQESGRRFRDPPDESGG